MVVPQTTYARVLRAFGLCSPILSWMPKFCIIWGFIDCVCKIILNREIYHFAVNNNQKESAEDREALGLDGSQGKKKQSGSNHDKDTFQGQIEVIRVSTL